MKDGSLIDIGIGDEPDRLDLSRHLQKEGKLSANLEEAFDRELTIRIYIGIPKLRLGRPNVGAADSDNANELRYHEMDSSLPEESWGGNEQELQFRRMNVQILVSTQDLSGYELLPIAQIKRASEGESAPQLDSSYIPPLLSIDAWPGLSKEIVRASTTSLVRRSMSLANKSSIVVLVSIVAILVMPIVSSCFRS